MAKAFKPAGIKTSALPKGAAMKPTKGSKTNPAFTQKAKAQKSKPVKPLEDAADMAMDKKMGIKEGSKKDNAMDMKAARAKRLGGMAV